MSSNYYTVLGVYPDATPSEIKRAYRKKVIQVHPDKPGGSSKEFEAVTEAYKVLSDSNKREAHDEHLSASIQRERPIQGSDIRIVFKAPMIDFVRGLKKTLVTNRKGVCTSCKGTGSENGKTIMCPSCHGSGIDPVSLVIKPTRSCPKCRGQKKLPAGEECSRCHGKGSVYEQIRKQVTLAPHMIASKCMVLHGCGNINSEGVFGNLIVDIVIDKDPVYDVRGLNIQRNLEISPAQAVLGDREEINVFGEKKTVFIPPGASNGQLIEMHREGLRSGSRKGSLLVRLRIKIPDKINEEERQLYEKILALEKEEPCLKTWRM